MTERLLPVARRPPSLLPLPLSTSGTVTTHGGLISPQTSESQFSATNNGFKPIDPTKVRVVPSSLWLPELPERLWGFFAIQSGGSLFRVCMLISFY